MQENWADDNCLAWNRFEAKNKVGFILLLFYEISWKVIIYSELKLRTSVVNCIEYGSWNKNMYCSSQTIIYDAFVSSIVHFKKFVIFALDNILKNTSQNWRNIKKICEHVNLQSLITVNFLLARLFFCREMVCWHMLVYFFCMYAY